MSVLIDVYSRKIVGWAMGRRMQDKLVTEAFNQAYNREKPKEAVNRPYRSGFSIYRSMISGPT
ncbi:integrase [Streptococcus pyogenes]|nr:integrase [Streptococcus pyogenes]SQH22390.1 integrase [Streptococcus pyogenes]VHC24930.1 transposase [Streptococcus pyogenes]